MLGACLVWIGALALQNAVTTAPAAPGPLPAAPQGVVGTPATAVTVGAAERQAERREAIAAAKRSAAPSA
jgi:hypothetical protein